MSEPAPVPMLDARGLRVAVIYSEFNSEVTTGLLDGATSWLAEAGADYTVARVLGAFELPIVAHRAVQAGFDGVVALGAVIEGETDHYEHIAHRASEGLMRVSLDGGVPVAFGVLTARDRSLVEVRSAPGPHNKGREAAAAVVAALQAIDVVETAGERHPAMD